MFGTTEIALIVFAILMLFGAKKIPQLARGVGEAVSELKKGFNGKEGKK